ICKAGFGSRDSGSGWDSKGRIRRANPESRIPNPDRIALSMSLLPFCEWLAGTRGSVALHESLYMYPLVESVHVLTLCVFVGMAVMLDLRLLGLTMRRVPLSEVMDRLGPWMAAGFTVMVITGTLLFYAIPVRSYQNIFFRLKMITLGLAGVNA